MNSKYIIRKNYEFDSIIEKGILRKNQYFIIYNMESKFEYNRYGISVPKKIGNAVTRNKIKRRLKDIISKNSIKKGYDYVIIVRKAIVGLKFDEIKNELLSIIKENNNENS